MRLADIFCFKATVVELEAGDRDGVIAELVSSLEKAGGLEKGNHQKLTRAVIKRENEASTGMGKGIAVPHVKHEAVKKVAAAIGRSSRGVDFRSLDKLPVHAVILLISPTNDPDIHLEAMKIIFGHLQNKKFRKFLRQSETTEAIEELLREADEDPAL